MNNQLDKFDFVEFNDVATSSDSNILLDLYALVMRKKWWFVLSVMLSLSVGVMWVWSTPKTYYRSATILIKSEGAEGSSVIEAIGLQQGTYLKSDYINDDIGLLMSTRLMTKVVERLNLEVEYRAKSRFKMLSLYTSSPLVVNHQSSKITAPYSFTATMIRDTVVEIKNIIYGGVEFDEEYTFNIDDEMSTVIGDISLSTTIFMNESYINNPIYISVQKAESVANIYKARLGVGLVVEQSNLIGISITDENINRAENIINMLVQVYQDDIIDYKNNILDNSTKFIDGRLAILKKELQEIDAEIEIYKKTNKLTDISSESNLYLQSSSRLDSEGLSIENQLNMAEYMRSYLVDNANISELIPVNVGVSDSGLAKLIGEYNTLLTERNNLLVNSSVNNPLVIDLQNTITPMRASILKSVENLIAGLKIQAETFKRKEEETSTKITDVPTQQKYIISVQREQKIKDELYLFLLNKREGSELRRTVTESNCQIVDPAQGASVPIKPNKKKVVLLAIIIGLMIPSAWLYLLSIFDVNVKTRQDLKGVVTIPILGELPLSKRVSRCGLIVSENNRSVVEERLKIIRDNINFMDKGERASGRIIQMTSLNPNSGKSFLTINLARSITLSGNKVIVIDIDLRKASLTKRSGIGLSEVGLSQYLSGLTDNKSEIVRPFGNDLDNVDIITSGALPPNPAELLSSDRLSQLLNYLRNIYDYIIIDNPPYLVVVDAAICSRLSDQTICVIRSNMFDKRQLPDLQVLYDSGKINNMSILINAIDYDKVTSVYGYGYGYGYGYNYDYEAEVIPFYKRFFRS